MSVIALLSKNFAKQLGGRMSPEVVEESTQRLAKKIAEADVIRIENGMRPIEGDPKAADYISMAPDMLFKKQDGISADEGRYFEALGAEVDPDFGLLTMIKNDVKDLDDKLSKFKTAKRPQRADVLEVPQDVRSNLEAHLSGMITRSNPDALSFLSPEGKTSIGKYLLDDILNDPDYDDVVNSLVKEFPKDTLGTVRYMGKESDSLLIKQGEKMDTEFNKKSFLVDSKWVAPVYRLDGGAKTPDTFLAGTLPRETGIHMGTSPEQSMSIYANSIESGPRSDMFYPQGMVGKTQGDIDSYFEGVMPRYEAQQASGVIDLEDSITLSPATISKGYISVKNPLRMEDMLKGWYMSEELKTPLYLKEFQDTVSSQLPKGTTLSNKAIKELEALGDKARRLDPTNPPRFDSIPKSLQRSESADPLTDLSKHYNMSTQGSYLDQARKELLSAQIHKELQGWLEKRGFDSIVYKNQVEGSLDSSPKDSYILFHNNQFKTVWNKDFNPKDHRSNYAHGGLISKALQ
jgi:hypothetical protein